MPCYSSIFRSKNSRTLAPSSLLHSLIFRRGMGGGPRTFPGGLNKWQWKRMHEKKAREKEKRLLEQEKQLYQARVRSEIRSKIVSTSDLDGPLSEHNNSPNQYDPMSPEEHIKALADRFMKEGAEDLWNEADGPVKTPPPQPSRSRPRVIGQPIDLRKLISDRDSNGFPKDRRFSTFSVNGILNLSNNSGAGSSVRCFSGYCGNGMFRNSMDHLNVPLRNDCPVSDYKKGFLRCYYIDALLKAKFLWGNLGNTGMVNLSNSLHMVRSYSVGMRNNKRPKRSNFRRGRCSSSEDDSDSDGEVIARPNGGTVTWPRLSSKTITSPSDADDDEDVVEERVMKGNVKRMMSSAALGKYDVKTKKRVPLKFLEEEDDSSQHVQAIRQELYRKKRSLEEKGEEDIEEESILSSKRFDECDVSPLTVKALTAAGYVQMTRVQEATLSACLEGKDALVKARTGTGKSAAFLLPAIETVLKSSTGNTNLRVPPIYVLILCPTRELASQLAAEANVMLRYHEGIGVQTLVGGTRFKLDQKRLETDPSQIIVATPGRLLDHIENKSGFSVRLMGLKMLILDEADHLLDLGFRKDIEKLVDCLPRQRQSLLFSATIPKEVRRISQLVLKREHAYIDTVGMGGLETHPKVKQSYIVVPHEQHFEVVHHLLKDHISQVVDYKVIVFCTTAMMTSLMYSLFRNLNLNVREMHSRKPQLYRTRISDEFKESKRLILITSDVSARGMNYPDVTLVIQVGMPSDREQYIHRLGRTGREGKEGEGILLLAPWEEYFLDDIKDLPLVRYSLPHLNAGLKAQIEGSMATIDSSVKEAAYHAWLGYYNSIREIGRDKTTLVELANKFCESIGMQKPPALYRRTALKMGLKDIPGIRIRK